LGREIEIEDMFTRQEQIGIYKNGMVEGGYCTRKYIRGSDTTTINGECFYGYGKREHIVMISSEKDPKTLTVSFSFTYGTNFNAFPVLLVFDDPFFNGRKLVKGYPNFVYEMEDKSNSEFENYHFSYGIKDSKLNSFMGAALIHYKQDKYPTVIDTSNGTRFTSYPDSFSDHINSIWSEIVEAEKLALAAQEKALVIKQNYLDKVCKPNVKVTFIDNDKYKAICTEDEKFKELFYKNMEIANMQKQQIRERIHRQNMENAAQQQAYAAQRQADAAQQQAFNQQIQNMNQNLNMQQQNSQMQQQTFQLQQINNYLRYGF
jgi:hypothetical protein